MNKLLIVFIFLFTSSTSMAKTNDWSDIEKIFGQKGNVQGDVFKITFPCSDLNIEINNIKLEPALAKFVSNGIEVTARERGLNRSLVTYTKSIRLMPASIRPTYRA